MSHHCRLRTRRFNGCRQRNVEVERIRVVQVPVTCVGTRARACLCARACSPEGARVKCTRPAVRVRMSAREHVSMRACERVCV
jgi:hypothetical protein